MYRLVNWALSQGKPGSLHPVLPGCGYHHVLFCPGDGTKAGPLGFLQQTSIWYVLGPVVPISMIGLVKLDSTEPSSGLFPLGLSRASL